LLLLLLCTAWDWDAFCAALEGFCTGRDCVFAVCEVVCAAEETGALFCASWELV
jgi:hypothetical protein